MAKTAKKRTVVRPRSVSVSVPVVEEQKTEETVIAVSEDAKIDIVEKEEIHEKPKTKKYKACA